MASRASFQKSPRRFSPGHPSGLMTWISMMPQMTRASSFVMPPLTSNDGGCQSVLKATLGRSIPDKNGFT